MNFMSLDAINKLFLFLFFLFLFLLSLCYSFFLGNINLFPLHKPDQEAYKKQCSINPAGIRHT